MTSALNATLVTGNGNEMILQNDMGNTLIEDSITGHVMGLNDGFIPVGMKEYGGILYIASYNPQTGDGELGTIPSPNIKYSELITDPSIGEIPLADLTRKQIGDIRLNTALIRISEEPLRPGDKYLIVLDLENIDKKVIRDGKEYPLFTKINSDGTLNIGYYRLELWARLASGKDVLLNKTMSIPQDYYTYSSIQENTSDYWFIPMHSEAINDFDFQRTLNQDLFRVYPNMPKGHLAIKIAMEVPQDIQLKENQSTQISTPYTFHVDAESKIIDAYSPYTGTLVPPPVPDLKPEQTLK